MLPLIPERGSCGASGDLVPLSYIGSAVVGEVDVLAEGEVRPAAEVLAELGLEPFELEAKEGLGLVNGTSFITAFSALAVADARDLADVSDLCTAMASEALLGNRGHFNAFLFEAKAHPGMIESARVIRGLLEGSQLALDSEEIFAGEDLAGREYLELHRQVQDKYSIRCAPHVGGMLRDTLDWAARWVEIEMNSSDDNPLFDTDSGRVQSGGNFYGGHMGQAMDSLKVALANLCDLMDRQLELVVDEKFNAGLTPNLIPSVRARASRGGPAPRLQGHAALLLGDDRRGAQALQPRDHPLALHRGPQPGQGVAWRTIAARDARSIVELAQNVAAIHLLAATQALDLRGPEKAQRPSRARRTTWSARACRSWTATAAWTRTSARWRS